MSAEPETIDQLIQRVARQTGEYAEALARTSCIPLALADQLVMEFNRALLAQAAGCNGPLFVPQPYHWSVPPASEVPK